MGFMLCSSAAFPPVGLTRLLALQPKMPAQLQRKDSPSVVAQLAARCMGIVARVFFLGRVLHGTVFPAFLGLLCQPRVMGGRRCWNLTRAKVRHMELDTLNRTVALPVWAVSHFG